MPNQAVDGQREDSDVDQVAGQSAEHRRDVLAAQPTAAFVHHQHRHQIPHTAAQPKGHILQQGVVLVGTDQQGSQHTAVAGCQRQLLPEGSALLGRKDREQQPHHPHGHSGTGEIDHRAQRSNGHPGGQPGADPVKKDVVGGPSGRCTQKLHQNNRDAKLPGFDIGIGNQFGQTGNTQRTGKDHVFGKDGQNRIADKLTDGLEHRHLNASGYHTDGAPPPSCNGRRHRPPRSRWPR